MKRKISNQSNEHNTLDRNMINLMLKSTFQKMLSSIIYSTNIRCKVIYNCRGIIFFIEDVYINKICQWNWFRDFAFQINISIYLYNGERGYTRSKEGRQAYCQSILHPTGYSPDTFLPTDESKSISGSLLVAVIIKPLNTPIVCNPFLITFFSMTVLFFFSMKKQEVEIEEKLDTFYLKKKKQKNENHVSIQFMEKIATEKLEGFNISIFNFYILFFV